MKTRIQPLVPALAVLALLSTLNSQLSTCFALGTAFTYQGRLTDAGSPATNIYDMSVTLWSTPSGSAGQVGTAVVLNDVPVTNGLFAVTLNAAGEFGASAFDGNDRWLEISVRPGTSTGAYTPITPRQPVLAIPYAITAGDVVNNGAGLTNLNASSLASGTVPDTRLSTNTALLNRNPQTFTGQNIFNSNVGIGATNPSGSLHISSSGAQQLYLERGGAISGKYRLGIAGANNNFYIQDEVAGGGTPRLVIDGSGGVGIGITSPSSRLHVDGGTDVEPGSGGYIVAGSLGDYNLALDNNEIMARFNGTTAPLYLNANGGPVLMGGNVGIGTTTPAANLEVRTAEEGIRLQSSSLNAGKSVMTFYELTGAPPTIPVTSRRTGYIGDASSSDTDIYLNSDLGNVKLSQGGEPVLTAGIGGTGPRVAAGPRVGIGTTDPETILDIRPIPYAENQDGGIQLSTTTGQFKSGMFLRTDANGVPRLAFDIASSETLNINSAGSGYVGIGTINPTAKLHVQGETKTCVLTITGGCDLAEPFEMSSKEMPKGALVVIDDKNPGKLKLSERAYDTRVAGIVSGANGINPGISLHKEGVLEGGENVALSGRVYAQADAAYGAIKPGDLLTTSDTPGHCMRVSNHDRAQGAIIGKAMSGLKKGKGMVLVLVSLQ